jgi:O-antigen/teichoic acid export membrane protein
MRPAGDAQRMILRGGIAAGLGYVVRFGARLLFLFVAARLFGVALFGAYALAVAAVELAVAVGGLGMKRYLFKLLDERPEQRLAAHVLLDAGLLVTAASLILAAFLATSALLLSPSLIAPNTAAALALVAPMVAGQALLDLTLAATRWRHRMRYEVTARSVVEPYAGILAALAAYGAGLEEAGLIASYWGGTLAALAYAAFGARRCFGGLALRSYRPGPLGAILRSASLPTATDGAAALFARLDLYLVGIFLGESAAGIYGMARQVRTPVRQVRQSLDGLLTPILARTLTAKGARQTGAATASAGRLILAIQLPMVIGLAAIGAPLLAWFGPEFAAGYWALVILAAAEAMQGAFGVSELILLYRRPSLALWITAASAAANVAAAWLLIDRFGLDGAALAVLVAVAVGALVRRIVLRTQFGIVVPLVYVAGPLAAAAVSAGAAFAILQIRPDLHLVALVVGLGAYGAALKSWLMITGDSLSLAHLHTD